ncbi:ParB/RepB/Spo0J family partition protein [Trichlorobacter lovleyi]|uniref:ParB-like partition protein n=1 Tax=Trichlorobacter lovleyi (strain ATCC BAA-1151 / DSM 17278 / SZ) TaxID=398767 RepID=B3E4Z1_TRIL1|nr:ParB/RepB/Spo0J family partition protein [Trichlorobacter lovleyi]ACD94556.1 parB-like partition protein [Trichlorobacter lovleyi SZ]
MEHGAIALIPIEDIHILNPRVRNQIIAEEIRQNIRSIGLKRPITVAPRKDGKNGKQYDLVCGQGRIEAFIAAGETEIPAIIREVSEEDAHIMSLVENIARRNNSALELLQSIKYLKGQGYADDAIAAKTNLGRDYIRGIIRLLEEGEEYLVNAVEKGRIPLYQALNIAAEDDAAVQTALTEAYESGALTGKKLVAVQKIISRRKHYGKGLSAPPREKANLSAEDLIAAYENGAREKKRLLAQSNYIKDVLDYTAMALRQLLNEVHFTNQLKAVGMNEIPLHVTELLKR